MTKATAARGLSLLACRKGGISDQSVIGCEHPHHDKSLFPRLKKVRPPPQMWEGRFARRPGDTQA